VSAKFVLRRGAAGALGAGVAGGFIYFHQKNPGVGIRCLFSFASARAQLSRGARSGEKKSRASVLAGSQTPAGLYPIE